MSHPVGIGILVPVEWELFETMVLFYSDGVGLPVVERGTSEAGNPWCTFEAAATTLTIHIGRDGNFPYPEFRPTGHGIALALEVGDIDSVIMKLEHDGIGLQNCWTYPDGDRAVSIADPAGNRIELWGGTNDASASSGS